MRYCLDQQFSAFLMLQSFETFPHVVFSKDTITLLLLHNSNFATIMNSNVNICYAKYLICYPWGVVTQRLSTTGLEPVDL